MSAGAGLIVRLRDERRFLPAAVVQKVVAAPRLSAVPGSLLKLALVDGRVLPVVELGELVNELVVCHAEGEVLALTGLVVEASGTFPASGDGVQMDGESIAPLDITLELGLALSKSRVATKV